MKKIVFLTLVILTKLTCFSQINQYDTPSHATYTPLTQQEIYAPAKMMRQRYDNNAAKVDGLINWIFELKKTTTESEFSLSMDYYYKILKSYYDNNLDLARMDTQIKQVELGIREAIELYNKRMSDVPKKLWESGNNNMKNNNYVDAISDYTNLININPDYIHVYRNRGIAYFYQKNYSLALLDLNKYIDLKSDDSNAFQQRGWVKYYLNDNMGSLRDFNRAIELEPNSFYSFYSRGSAKSNLDDQNGAISDYTRSIEIKPDFSMGYNNRGWAKFKLKRYSEALIDLNKSIELDPTNSIAFDSRQETKFALNDLKGCLQDCNKAISLNPNLSNSYYYRGRVNYRLGNKSVACEDWSKAGELGEEKAYEAIRSYCK